MSTITTIAGSDVIANSRADINSNFSNLNTDKEEVSNKDTDTSLAANSDTKYPSQKAVKTYIDTSGGANASETVRGIVEEATDAEVTAGTATGGTGAKLIVTPAKLATRLTSLFKFGGTGSDGALSITSGTTTIDCANAAVVVKNYTSISITGTGTLAFSNPHANGTIVILKSQGAVTLTSSSTPMINMSGMGGAGGGIGAVGTAGLMPGVGVKTNFGTAGASGPVQGSGGAITSTTSYNHPLSVYTIKYIHGWVGAGGGGGGPADSGSGGRGGGMLVIECAGAWNFTTSSGISVAGANGGNATGNGCGGGGGSGGAFIALVGSITANSGTITVSGGTGGTHGATTTQGGGGGGSPVAAGASGSGSGGGAGANGYSAGASVNTEFV